MKTLVVGFLSCSALLLTPVVQADPVREHWETAYANALVNDDKRALTLLQDRYDALPAGIEKLYVSSKLHEFMQMHGQPYFGNQNATKGAYSRHEELFIDALNSEEKLNFSAAKEGYISLLNREKLGQTLDGKILFEYHLCKVLNRQALYHQASIYCSSLNTHIQDAEDPILPKHFALREIANNQEFIGNHKAAIDTYQKLLTLLPSYVDASGVYNDAGLLLSNIGKYDQAEAYITKALTIREKNAHPQKLAQVHHSMGRVRLKQENYPSAIQHFTQVKLLSEQLNYAYGLTFAYLGLGEAYIAIRDFELGRTYLLAALENATKQNNSQLRGEIYLALAGTHKEQDQLSAAQDFATQALELGKSVASARLIAQSLALLAEISERQGSFDKALSYYRQYTKSELQKRDQDSISAVIALDLARRDNENRVNADRLAHENQNLIAANHQLQRRLTFISLCVIALISLLIVACAYYNHRNKQLKWDGIGKALNRTACIKKIKAQKATSQEHHKNVLILLDLDNFKTVNSQYGHAVGDRFLTHIVKLIQHQLGVNDVVGRLGGEELLILCSNVDELDVELRVQQIQKAIANASYMTKDSQSVSITASCAYLATTRALCDFDELYSLLDQAMSLAKRKGSNRIIDAYNAPIYSATETFQPEMPLSY